MIVSKISVCSFVVKAHEYVQQILTIYGIKNCPGTINSNTSYGAKSMPLYFHAEAEHTKPDNAYYVGRCKNDANWLVEN